MNTIGKRVVHARQQREMSQADLGRAIGVSQTAIYLLETRKRSGTSYLYAIAQALGVNVQWLATGKGPIYVNGNNLARLAPAMLKLLKQAESKLDGALQEDVRAMIAKAEG